MPTKTKETFPARVQLEALAGHPSASVGVTCKTGFIVKQGDLVGKITASSKYRRRSRTTAAGTGFAADSPIGFVTDNTVFHDGDVITKSDGTAVGTVAVDGIDTVDPTKVTLTANAANAMAADVALIATDGSAVAQGIADAETDGTADTPIAVIVSGKLVEAKLRGLDASAKSDLAGASVAGGIFKF
jgi:hypothetical protein